MRFKESRKYSLQLDSQTNTQSHHVDSHHRESQNRHCEPCRMQGVAIHNNINTADSKKILDSTPIIKSPFCDYESMAKGLFIFSIGLFKKVFIADSFAKWANAGFSAVEKGEILNIFESWITALSYTFQLYFDFSGYCDMAIGLGLLFGIMLPINFNSPYKALNIADFWRRWHITLGRFLREYVYIPLGGNRNMKHSKRNSSLGNHLTDFANFEGSQTSSLASPPKFAKNSQSTTANTRICEDNSSDSMAYSESTNPDSKAIASSHQKPSLHNTLYNKLFTLRNLFIVAFLSGIWHGAGWGFVVWGTLHGIAMCVQRVYVMFYTKLDATNPYRIFMHTKMYKVLCWFLTFNFINIAWVFFRAENLNGALNLLKGMFGGVVVLPTFLESRLGFLSHIRINGAHISFGRWAEAIQSSSTIVLPSVLGALVLCLAFANSIQSTKAFRPQIRTLAFGTLLFYAALFMLGSHATTEFLYFNF